MRAGIGLGSLVAVVSTLASIGCVAGSPPLPVGETGLGGGNGGGSGSGGSAVTIDSDTTAASAELSLSQNTFAPGAEVASVGTAVAPAIMPAASAAYPACHPHLFARGVEYSLALNYHVNLFLHHADDLLKVGPKTKSGTTVTWIFNGADEDAQVVLDKTAPGQFTLTFGVAAPGSTTFTTVVTGTINRSNPDDVTKQFTFDFDALHTVFPAASGDLSQGTLAMSVERTKNASTGADLKRTVTYTLTGFEPVYGDPHGPRTGNIYFLDEPGVGGAMVYDASAVYFCPANPTQLSADSNVLMRWYLDSGTVSGRADAIATGGQFPSGNRWVGLSCRNVAVSAISASGPSEDNGYWLMKEEDSSGATVEGEQVAVADANASDAPCNPAFGAVTDLNDDTNDPTIPTTIPSDAFPGQF